jgi:protein-tyrosine phosphatase
MHSHSTNPSMFPMSPISPWGASTLSVPPNTPLSSTHPNANHHHSPSVSPTEIIPHLYLSDLADAENPTLLASLGITHVFSAMPGFVNIPTHTTHTRIPKPILRAQIPIEDNPFAELAAHLPSSTAFIREALRDPEANVLVHCVQGISRSASVVCAFLMAFYGWPPTKAVAFVKTKRWIAEPNFGFVTQLHEYEKTLQQQQQQAHGHGQGHAR